MGPMGRGVGQHGGSTGVAATGSTSCSGVLTGTGSAARTKGGAA